MTKKSEFRNPKSETSTKPEIGIFAVHAAKRIHWSGSGIFVIRICFEFRHSDFEFVRLFFSLVDHQLIAVGIAELRHPTNRRFSFLDVEGYSAFFKLRDGRIDVSDLEGDRCPVAGRLPSWMTTDSDRSRPEIILDPRAIRLYAGGR